MNEAPNRPPEPVRCEIDPDSIEASFLEVLQGKTMVAGGAPIPTDKTSNRAERRKLRRRRVLASPAPGSPCAWGSE